MCSQTKEAKVYMIHVSADTLQVNFRPTEEKKVDDFRLAHPLGLTTLRAGKLWKKNSGYDHNKHTIFSFFISNFGFQKSAIFLDSHVALWTMDTFFGPNCWQIVFTNTLKLHISNLNSSFEALFAQQVPQGICLLKHFNISM